MISLRSKITQKLLNYFFMNPHERRYLNELARLLEVDPKNLDRKLKELEKHGLFDSDWSGKQRYYFLNEKFPLLNEYKQMVKKTIGFEHMLREAMKDVLGVEEVYIYGSYASDNMDAYSDIDILIVGDCELEKTGSAIWDLQKIIQREINPARITPDELAKKRKEKDFFYTTIFSSPIVKVI
ncbi:hypothetical protein HOG48_02640 [Candidatus Peregrinibacteria bacterium]|nr:hypothetical protein [Candidatus Peregrinibacteria bacterium]